VLNEIDLLTKLKISCFSKGIEITSGAASKLSHGGTIPLSIHEYATTGGITFRIGDVFINAPFDEWFCNEPAAIVDIEQDSGKFFVLYGGRKFFITILPLPGYLGLVDNNGHPLTDISMSHADRLRISPISGCAFGCSFCDFKIKKYDLNSENQIINSMQKAVEDTQLPIKHILISGGTPNEKDYSYYEKVCEKIITEARVPVDIMLAPRQGGILENFIKCGCNGFSINLEIYNREIANKLMTRKWDLGLSQYARFINKALELTGGNGKVRSLLILGLEPLEDTIKGIEFLAKLGCDPVLSPFRPARGTSLEKWHPPTEEFLKSVYFEAQNIVSRYGVMLGPRCIPCQHNTLTIPTGNSSYFYS